MDFSNYSIEIRTITDSILTKGVSDPQACLELCPKLIQQGKEEEDSKLLGFGYYYLARAYFTLNDYNRFVEYLHLGIEYQKESAQWPILARSYNLLGVNAVNQGNVTVALDQYLYGLKIGRKHHCEYEKVMIYNNLGQLYMRLEEYDRAIQFFLKAEQLLRKFQSDFRMRKNIIILYTMLGSCYLELEKKSEAQKVETEIKKWMQGDCLENIELLLVQIFYAQLRHVQEEIDRRDWYIAEVLKNIESSQVFLEVWEDIFRFGDFLLSVGKYEELKQLFDKVEDKVEQIQVNNMKAEFLRLKIHYYQKQGNREAYLEACAMLYEYGEKQNKENIAMLQRSAELRFRLEEAKGKEKMLLKETTILRERAERDALTGLPNRYRLKEFAEEIFEKAYKEQTNFGIEILDVDYFKQYNDGYGHQKGDECLQIIGKVLMQMMEEQDDIFCARYGGDEFVIIYYGKTDEEILHQAVHLRKRILKKKIMHDYSPNGKVITISQGIHNTVPEEKKYVWDYLHSADGALYQAKQCEKNSVCMKYEKDDKLVDTVVLVSRRKDDI